MCYCTPSIRTPRCNRSDCYPSESKVTVEEKEQLSGELFPVESSIANKPWLGVALHEKMALQASGEWDYLHDMPAGMHKRIHPELYAKINHTLSPDYINNLQASNSNKAYKAFQERIPELKIEFEVYFCSDVAREVSSQIEKEFRLIASKLLPDNLAIKINLDITEFKKGN